MATRIKAELSEDAKKVWQYVAQEIELIDRALSPLRENIRSLREDGQLND